MLAGPGLPGGAAGTGLADEGERTAPLVPSPDPADRAGEAELAGAGTLLPFYLDPMTKLFLVALIRSGRGC